MPAFAGFPDALFGFFDDLDTHNDRAWFETNKARYRVEWLEPAVAYCDAVLPALARLEPPAHGEARVNGSIWRIQRDTRFSADKTPYKVGLSMAFWIGADRKRGVSHYLGIDPEGAVVGCGMYGFERDALARYRAHVASDAGAALHDAVSALVATGWRLGGDALKTVPRGMDPDHPRAALLRHKGLYVMRDLDRAVITSPRVVEETVAAWRAASPFAAALAAAVA